MGRPTRWRITVFIFLIIVSIACGLLWLKSLDNERVSTKETKYFGWGCLIAAFLAAYLYSEDRKQSSISHGEQIHFNGSNDDIYRPYYTLQYTLPAYDGYGNKVCNVEIKSNSKGELFAFPNGDSSPKEFWNAPYGSPGTYCCVWGGGFIYF